MSTINVENNVVEFKKKFDEESFDEKVCRVTSDIHYNAKSRSMERIYDKWYHDNVDKLEKLFTVAEISDLFDQSNVDDNFNDFCIWVFKNTYNR